MLFHADDNVAPYNGSGCRPRMEKITEDSTTTSSAQEEQHRVLPLNAQNLALLSDLDTIPTSLPEHQKCVYQCPTDFRLLEFMSNPIWVFDPRGKCMVWANRKGYEFWGAETLQALIDRDFATGMSEATIKRDQAWMPRYQQGDSHNLEWTFHPNGGRDGPKTVDIEVVGIYVSIPSDAACQDQPHKLCQLCIVQSILEPRGQEDINRKRRMEMMRHFPAVARQFNEKGQLMDQNTEALEVFGSPQDAATNDFMAPMPRRRPKNDAMSLSSLEESGSGHPSDRSLLGAHESAGTTLASDSSTIEEAPNDFLKQFVDVEEGRKIWDKVKNGHETRASHRTEILQNTVKGKVWCSIKVRSIKDPITSEPVVIYSAQDISDIMKLAQEEAEKQARAKNEFFAVMAHEIRTPLHQVVGFIDLLSESSANLTEEQNESIRMMHFSANSLIAIINDVLDFTKLEAGEMKLENIPFELRMVVESSTSAVQQAATKKGLQINQKIARSIPVKLMGDPNRLRQIVSNLLTNAVKFTDSGQIDIEAICKPARDGRIFIRLSVKDTGIGMSKEHQSRIFAPFQQADTSISRTYGGTGLGVTICKLLSEKMGGTIGVKSRPGYGSKFWIEIPFEEYKSRKSKNMAASATNKTAPVSEAHSHLRGLRVLVVEDNKVNQKVVSRMLTKFGHKVEVADNGRLAIEALASSTKDVDNVPFDAVLMDWQMPVMDGIDATKEIRNLGFKLPVVGLTASIQGLDWRLVGMNDCLKKPVRMAELQACLEKIVIRDR